MILLVCMAMLSASRDKGRRLEDMEDLEIGYDGTDSEWKER
jgi:hypothetical protein